MVLLVHAHACDEVTKDAGHLQEIIVVAIGEWNKVSLNIHVEIIIENCNNDCDCYNEIVMR